MKRFTIACLIASACGVLLAENYVDSENSASIETNGDNTAEFSVFPQAINLSDARDTQTLIGQLQLANGLTQDVSESLEIQMQDSNIADRVGNRIVPKSDGETVAHVKFQNLTFDIPVKVTGAKTQPAISFKNDAAI